MSALSSLYNVCSTPPCTRRALRCPAVQQVPTRTGLVLAAAQYGDVETQQQAPRPAGRGGRGGGRGTGGYGYNNRQAGFSSGYDSPAGYEARRGPVTYDEESDGAVFGSRGGGRGGRGRGGGRGGGRDGQPRAINPETQAVNDAINNANSWRELQATLEQQSRPGMPGLDSFQLVALLLRLVKLERPKQGDDAADFQQFVASVYGWMMNRMAKFKSRQISGALYAISRLQLYNAELVGALIQASLPQLGYFGAIEYVRFLDGLERMRVPPGEEWTAEFFRVSAPKIVRTAEKDELAAIFSCCQRLGLVPTPEWLAATTGAAMEQLGDRSRQMRAAEFRRLVVGLAGLGWRPAPEQLQLIVDRSFPQLNTRFFQINDLVQLAWALAQWETPMPPTWAKVFSSCLMRMRHTVRPADLGSLLYSLAYLRAGPDFQQLQQLLSDLKIQFDDATGDDLANVAMALVQFGFTPEDRFMDDFLIELKRKLPTCSATGLNNVISALPAMGSGIRLNEVATEAVSRYDALMAEQQYSGAAAVEAADMQQYEAQTAAAAEQQPVA